MLAHLRALRACFFLRYFSKILPSSPPVPPASPGPGLRVLSEALPASMDCFHLFLSKAPLHTCTTAISQTLREVNHAIQGFLIIHCKEVGLQKKVKGFDFNVEWGPRKRVVFASRMMAVLSCSASQLWQQGSQQPRVRVGD